MSRKIHPSIISKQRERKEALDLPTTTRPARYLTCKEAGIESSRLIAKGWKNLTAEELKRLHSLTDRIHHK